MRISILTPSFNSGSFLERNIQSVLAQDHPDIEHVITDGGSTDGTVDILKRYSDKLGYWVSEKDAGQSDALQKALRQSTGDIIGWLNVDETYEPNVLGAVHRAFEENPEAVLVYGHVRRVTVDGREIRVNRQQQFDYETMRVRSGCIVSCSAFFKRSRLIECGGFDPAWHYIMDYELYIRFMRGNQKWVRLDRVLSNFTMHAESKTSKFVSGFQSEIRRLREREFPGMTWEAIEKESKRQMYRMMWRMFLDGVLWEKMWFKVVRQRHFEQYFGDPGVRLPVISWLLDRLDPVRPAAGGPA